MTSAIVLLAAGLTAAALTFASNWLALIPWRNTRGRHWTERARVYHPVRVAAASNLWIIPAGLGLTVLLLPGDRSPHWISVFLVSSMGAIAGTIPMDREVFPRIGLRSLVRLTMLSWSMRVLPLLVFAAAIIFMPARFGLSTVVISLTLVGLCIFWTHGGFIHIGRMLGLFRPPEPRLETIVRDTATQMNVSVKQVWVARIPLAQAFALPPVGTLLFSERLLEIFPDEEIRSICAHELAHLTEGPGQYARRYVVWLTFLPWIFIHPTLRTFGLPGLLILLSVTILGPVLYRRVCRPLEVRADQMAQANEAEEQSYARALARLYEDSLLPAVHAKNQATHPHLYDRLIAAGMTPDFDRPEAARSMAWHGRFFALAIGVVIGLILFSPKRVF